MRGRAFLGVLLVIVGVVFLLGRLGYVEWYHLVDLIRFWPVLLIAFGVALLFPRNTWVMPVLLVVLVLGAAAYVAYAPDEATGTNSVTLEAGPVGAAGLSRVSSNIEFAAGELRILGQAEHVADLTAQYSARLGKPELNYSAQDDHGTLSMSYPEGTSHWSSWWPGPRQREVFDLRLNDGPVHDITTKLAAGIGELDLSDLVVERLAVDMAAGQLNVTFGMPGDDRVAQTEVQIKMAAGQTRLEVPAEAGVALHLTKAVGSTNVGGLGWIKNGDSYYSPNYDDAAYRLAITANLAAGTFDIHTR